MIADVKKYADKNVFDSKKKSILSINKCKEDYYYYVFQKCLAFPSQPFKSNVYCESLR